jgi:PTS system fructose-specific IIB component
MKIAAITACPTGIAHTYMAADALKKAATKFNVQIKVETQGAMGVENTLSGQEIASADKILIVSAVDIEGAERFDGIDVIHVSIEDILVNADKFFLVHCHD